MTPRIAFVKQDVYQDLYVCPHTEKDAANILFSSQGRVGPIGLMAELGADFYIVKEEQTLETQIYRKVIPHIADYLYLLKTQTLDKLPGQGMKQPGSSHPQGEFAVSCYEIDWGCYDIVVSVNVSLPQALICKYPRTLFGYMIGEANIGTRRVCFGYDVSLNQKARGKESKKCGVVDFPYTFLKGDTLERILTQHIPALVSVEKKGVFVEINSTTERPVTRVPEQFLPLQQQGQEMILHKQRISDNLQSILRSKYFVKMGGRPIRGNSAVEAISCGSLVIMNRDEIIHKELIIEECDVRTMDEVIRLIEYLENNPGKYMELLKKQRDIVTHYFYEIPLRSLINCMEYKRLNHPAAKSYTIWDKCLDKLCFLKLKYR